MNPNIRFDQSIYLILYARYKAYLLPLGVIVACIFAFVFFVIPQFQNYLNNKDTVAADETTIQNLQSNITALNALQASDISKNLAIATSALPSEKDYSGILNAISQAASTANVSLGNYSIQVGALFGNTTTTGAASGQLTISVTLSISGNLASTQKFIQALEREFPLSEVNSVSVQGQGGAQIIATFFYNPLPAFTFSPSNSIAPLSSQQQKLMTSLKKDFQKPQDVAIPKIQVPITSPTPTP